MAFDGAAEESLAIEVTWPLLMEDATTCMVGVEEMVAVVDGGIEVVAVSGGDVVAADVVAAGGGGDVDERIGVAVQGETVCKY